MREKLGEQTRDMMCLCLEFTQRVDGRRRMKIGGEGIRGQGVMEEAQT